MKNLNVIIIDNYDSFTFNLYQYTGEILKGTGIKTTGYSGRKALEMINKDDGCHKLGVIRNDAAKIEEIAGFCPTHIIISPGPGYPDEAGISVSLVKGLGNQIPILGVCLGHQSIGEAYGGKIIHAPELMHGKASEVILTEPGISQCSIFEGVAGRFEAGRYHSLIVDRVSLPESLVITAETEDGIIMAVRHRDFPVYGIQFHPESILTPSGKKILSNFLFGINNKHC